MTTSTIGVVAGSVAFAVFWVLAVFPAIPILPVGRTAGALLGAVLMVVCCVITPSEAYSSIDLSILGLLFGTMTIVIYLDRAGMFTHLGKMLTWKSFGPKDFTIRVSFVSAVSAAFFTNDTSCVAFTEYLIAAARRNNLSPRPFLLALASAANIGSAATPIGNPQNLVIALKGNISFLDFLRGILPAAVVGVLVNALILLCLCWSQLKGGEPMKMDDEADVEQEAALEPETIPLLGSAMDDDLTSTKWDYWKMITWKACVYLITLGMLVAMCAGLNMSWSAITAALALVVLDFKDAQACLDKVTYSILVFFCGMFITVDGFDETGIPGAMWEMMEPYAQIDSVSGIIVLSIVIIILCNLVSNVPTVLLLGSRIAASAGAISAEDEKRAWLILAWVSTVAGNLTLLGSAANLIVCERARLSPAHLKYELSFSKHLIFGIPSTLIVTAIGLTLI